MNLPQQNTDKSSKFSIFFVAIGTALEWYDFIIFAYLTVYLQHVFWGQDHVSSLIYAYGTFALAYVTRPLGGIFFGIIGDRYGRKISILLSSLMIAISMLIMGLLPSYAMVGGLAVILLVVMRLIQGISLGGEYTGTTVLLLEYGNLKQRRGLLASFSTAFSSIGYFFSLLVVNLLTLIFSKQDMIHFGWRIPYFLGFVLGIIFFILRTFVKESHLYRQDQTTISFINRIQIVLQHKKTMIKTFLLLVFYAMTYYGIVVYLPNVLGTSHGFMGNISKWFVNFLMLIYIGLNIYAGYLSDIWGRKKVLRVFSIISAVVIIPVMLWYPSVWWLLTIPFLLMPFIDTVSVLYVPEFFDSSIRMTAQGFLYPLAAMVGGFTPMILTKIQMSYSFFYVGIVLAVLFIGMLGITFVLKETYKKVLT